MAAPTIHGGSTAYTGYAFGDLCEHGLNERGLTADANSTEFTPASTAQQNKNKMFVKDGIAYLFQQRENWFPAREAEATAEASGGTYSAVPIPADCGRLDAIVVGNIPLTPISLDAHLANLRPTSEGGGSYLGDDAGEPAYYRLAVTQPVDSGDAGSDTSDEPARMHAIVLPTQSAAFTARFFYRSSGQNLVETDDVVYLHVVMHPLLVLYLTYRWALDDGNVIRANAFWQHLQDRLDEVSHQPPALGVLPVVKNTYPSETAGRNSN